MQINFNLRILITCLYKDTWFDFLYKFFDYFPVQKIVPLTSASARSRSNLGKASLCGSHPFCNILLPISKIGEEGIVLLTRVERRYAFRLRETLQPPLVRARTWAKLRFAVLIPSATFYYQSQKTEKKGFEPLVEFPPQRLSRSSP